jgi:WD40 repeat protein
MKKIVANIIMLLVFIHGVNGQTVDWSMKANPLFNSINGVAFKADGQKVLSGTNCHPASIRIFDVNSGAMDWDYTVGSSYMCIMGVTFSSNSNYIAAIEEFGNIFIFDNTGSSPVIIDTINTGTSYGFSTAISPANTKVAVGCSNGKMKIYSIPNGVLSNDINAHLSWVTTVAYSPDGNKIVTGGSDDKVKVWSNAGTLLFTCTGHTGDITSVKVTPDNNFAVSSSKDDKIKIWSLLDGSLVQTIDAHADDVNGMDVSPDGTMIVSASSDSTCKIWSFSTGNLLSTFGIIDSGAVNTVAWSPNGDKIVTGNILSDVVLWSIPPSLGINNVITNDFSFAVFPNPASDQIHLSLPETEKIQEIKVFDVIGNVVYSSSRDDLDLVVRDYKPGTYILTIHTKEKKKSRQLFLKK